MQRPPPLTCRSGLGWPRLVLGLVLFFVNGCGTTQTLSPQTYAQLGSRVVVQVLPLQVDSVLPLSGPDTQADQELRRILGEGRWADALRESVCRALADYRRIQCSSNSYNVEGREAPASASPDAAETQLTLSIDRVAFVGRTWDRPRKVVIDADARIYVGTPQRLAQRLALTAESGVALAEESKEADADRIAKALHQGCDEIGRRLRDAIERGEPVVATKRPRPGVPPLAGGLCPEEQPIKGNFTPYSGERCIYHRPAQRYYPSTNAERCYATEVEAVRDGCRASMR